MRFSLAIAIAVLLGSYVSGVPVLPNSPPEEGEISDDGSPGHNGNTPEGSHRSGGTGSGASSSNPSIGLGLNRQNRGQLGTAELGHYATPERYDRNPGSTHWAISHPVVGHGEIGPNLAVTPMTSSRTTDHPAGNYGFTNQKDTSHLEVAGGPRFIPASGFHPSGTGEGSMQMTDKGYRDLARANRDEINKRPGDPPPTPHNPSYNPQVLAPMHWGASTSGPSAQSYPGPGGMPPPHRQSTLPAYPQQPSGYQPHFPARQQTLPAPGLHGLPPPPAHLPAPPHMYQNPQGGLPPPPAHLPAPPHMYQNPQGGLPPPPAHLPAPPHMYQHPQGGLPPPPAGLPAPPHMYQHPQGGLPPPPAGFPAPPHMYQPPQGGLPPPPAGLPARPLSRGGSGRRGSRYQPYPRGGGPGAGV